MSDLTYYATFALSAIPVAAISLLLFVSWITHWPQRDNAFFFADRYHYSADGKCRTRFSNLLSGKSTSRQGLRHTKPELYLSVVIPAMNEAERLPIMLNECLEYLRQRSADEPEFTYEVIVVDDGSHDDTADVALKCGGDAPLFVCKMPENIGKGGAVRVGVLCSRGKLILFADADGATKFSDLAKLEREMHRLCNGDACRADPLDWTHPAVVVGSRSHLEKESLVKRTLFRTILMFGFHLTVKLFSVRSIRDTQCGFKLFSRAAAAKLFPQLHIERWAFDVELLYLAERLHYSLAEVPVQWTEIDGSKITPVFSWIQMGRDIVLIWFRYTTVWRVVDRPVAAATVST